MVRTKLLPALLPFPSPPCPQPQACLLVQVEAVYSAPSGGSGSCRPREIGDAFEHELKTRSPDCTLADTLQYRPRGQVSVQGTSLGNITIGPSSQTVLGHC